MEAISVLLDGLWSQANLLIHSRVCSVILKCACNIAQGIDVVSRLSVYVVTHSLNFLGLAH